jgi:dihydropteroate synthase
LYRYNSGGVRASLTRAGAGCLARAPMLLGASRKGFLGAVTGREVPAERDAATSAACVAGVLGGADVMRVHDVAAVADALKVADAVWRHRARARAVAYMEQRRKNAWLVKESD